MSFTYSYKAADISANVDLRANYKYQITLPQAWTLNKYYNFMWK